MKFPIGMRVYNNDLSFYAPRRKIDFLVDNKTVTKDDIIFIIEEKIHPDYEIWFNEMGYETTTSVNYPDPPFENYVQYNTFSKRQMLKNKLLGMRGVRTWAFMHANNTADLFTPDRSIPKVEQFKGLAVQEFMAWNGRMKSFYQHQTKYVDHYHITGCPWSEHVREVIESGRNPTLGRAIKKWGCRPDTIISVFDTTVRDGFEYGNITQASIFLNWVKMMLYKDDELHIMFKVKNFTSRSVIKYPLLSCEMLPTGLDKEYMELADHPRCYMEYDLDSAAEEFIAAADLVISAPFSSTLLEAIGAGKPAEYALVYGNYQGSHYTQFPTLLCDEVDPFRDGQGITRMRELIMG